MLQEGHGYGEEITLAQEAHSSTGRRSAPSGFAGMNDNRQNDESLKKVLHQWKVNEPLPPRFQEQVWSRINKLETDKVAVSVSIGAIFANWFERTFTRPALAFSYVAALVVVGMTTAHFQAQHHEERLKQELAARYVQAVDPYQTPRH